MSSVSSNLLEPVAIVGIACEFAGDIHSPTDLWHALEQCRDVGSAVPRDRLDLESYCAHMFNKDNDGQFRHRLIRGGYFLSNYQWDMFEASFFGLSDAEAGSIDPCHRLLMLKFVHLLDDAGYSVERVNGTRTSVHIGQFSTDHAITSFRMEPEHRSRFHGPNSLLYNAAARLSYHFNLQGPNVSLDVACSSSLEAVHMAVQALRTHEADMAVCGGVNAVYTPENLFYSSTVGAQSPDGRSRSFSSDANGYAKGDGLGLLLLKRLSDAERDGDRVYCVIRDVLSNHDGNEDKSSFVVPSGAGQARLLSSIYTKANCDPRRIFYVEAHGTGTPVGDPIEANCLGRFFNRSSVDPPLLIGSIKSNLGHTEGAAGVASLIKVAMCMHHRSLPPNMHFTSLNPKIEAQRYNLHVVQHFVPFPCNVNIDPVAIGVNSFGMGGTTTHAIIEEYRPDTTAIVHDSENNHVNVNNTDSKQYFIFIFSTKSRKSLNDQVAQFYRWLEKTTSIDASTDCAFLQRVSQQLLLKRTISYPHLAIFVFANRQQLQEQIGAFLAEQTIAGLSIVLRPTISPSQICFVFSGQGPQWWAMGRQLYDSEPIFTKWIRLIDAEMTNINNGEWRLLEELIEKKSEHDSRINDTNIAQPALFAIQVGVAALLVSWNIYPSAIVSHSAGDQAAAFVAGRLTLQEAVCIVYHRSRLQNRNTRQGGRMLAVSMSEEEVESKLLKGIQHLVCVAVVNSPRSVTLSGDEKTIDELQHILSTFHPNVFKARLRIENAFHSYQMDRFDIEKEMLSALKDIRGLPLQDPQQMFDPQCAQARLYSSVIGGRLSDQIPVDGHYWWSNVRQCVRFRDAIASIVQDEPATIFLELSPHPVLATSIRECYESTNHQPLILPTLKRKEDEQITLLTAIAQLTTSTGVWQQYFYTRDISLTKDNEQLFDDFPLYAFYLSPCWYESRDSVIKRLANRIPSHPLLGVRQLTGQTTPTWKSLININLPQYAFLKDHKIQDAILFPAVAYLELATAACRQLLSTTGDKQLTIIFEQIKFVKALVLNEHELTEIFTQIVMPMREWFIYSRPWSSAGPDCMRSSGMASVDIIESFLDQHTLSQYSLNEFTLHAHGRIEIENIQQKSTTVLTIDRSLSKWSTHDPKSVYSHLLTRGYQYGPSFQNIQSLHGTNSTVIADISRDLSLIDDLICYHLLHPTVLDTCLHSLLVLLPGVNRTFLPVSIQKFTTINKLNTCHSSLEVRGKYHDNVCGLGQVRTYTCDFAVFPSDTTTEEPMFIFDGVIIQQVQGTSSGRWTQGKSVFDKLNAAVDLPNVDRREYSNTLIKDYCMQRTWTNSSIITSAADLLPSLEQILNAGIDVVSNEDLIQSIKPFNELAACYAQIAIRELDLNLVDNQYHPLLNACRSLASIVHEPVTLHSTQIRLMHLFDRFPRLKPLLISLNAYGSRIREVFSGEQSGLDVFLGNDKTDQTLQLIQSIISASKSKMIFHAIDQHLRFHYDQERYGPLSHRRLRLLWIASGEHLDFLSILHLLLNLSHQTNLWIDLHYVDTDSIHLAEAEHIFETHLADQTHFSVTYDHTLDLFNIQSFEQVPVESFDIVFAANKLQGCQDLTKSLIAFRRLLVPNGFLFLLETMNAPLFYDLIFGLLDQWWSPAGNTRALNSIQQWTTFLKEVGGFTGVETIPSQYESTIIIAQKTASLEILRTLDERRRQAWLFFGENNHRSLAHIIAPLLPCSNIEIFDVSNTKFDIIRPQIPIMLTRYQQVYIVFAWPFEQMYSSDNSDSAFKQHEESICGTFVQLLQIIHATSPHFTPFVFMITRDTQFNVGSNGNIFGSPLIGLARSLMIEYGRHRLKLIDLQAPSTLINESTIAHALTQYMVTSRYANNTDEIVLRLDTNENQVHYVTWHYEMLQKHGERKDESIVEHISLVPRIDADQKPFRLCVAPSRFLTDLTWIQDERAKELLPGMIEVRIHCVGVNFRDVLKARGLYPHTRAFAQLDEHQPHVNRDIEPGSDFVGTVVRVCPSVKFQLGDRVVGISAHGVFHSHVIVPSSQVVCIPIECRLTDEQLSAMPVVCLTVIYSLKYRVHLRYGQTVLIHAATGGAGQICIQYCQWIGARVLATAGTEEKRRFLHEHYGIEHVFNSRDTSFVSDVKNILPNGVDVVINSLSGVLLQESIKLLAYHGHFVEWGKRDVFDKTSLSLFDLRSDCSFHVIDLISLSDKQQDICTTMLQEMMDLFMQGKFKPIEPTVVYEPSQVIEAFMRCNSGQVMGKAVVRLTSSAELLYLDNERNSGFPGDDNNVMFPPKVCNQGTIVISGGFGGLGLTMSRWMIEKRSVKRVILMSRRTLVELEQPSNPQYDEWLRLKQTMDEHNAHVDVVQADVTDFDQVLDLIEKLNQTPHPIRGIIHSAVVSDDRTLNSITQEHLTHVLAAKVRGAWNLHQATQLTHTPLHFFVMFSSIRNHLLELASGGYNAGNQFLDALAHYRQTQFRLPALSVSLPAVSGAGMFHRQRDMLLSFQSTQGFELVPTEAVFELIERFHAQQKTCPCPVIFAVNWQTLYDSRHKLPTFRLCKIVEEQYAGMNLTNISATSSEINSLTDSNLNRRETIIERTQAAVSRLLGAANIDRILVDRSLVSQGMDSLAALSLYNWLGQETGVYIPLADLLQGLSIETIATVVHNKLNERQQVSSSTIREQNIDIDLVKENEITLSNSPNYTGTENIICLKHSSQFNSRVLFCIAKQSTTDIEHLGKLFIDKISEQQSQTISANIYAIQIPTMTSTTTISTCARDIILQMRRIQPCGPYQLVAIRNKQEETIAHEMIKQLKDHSMIIDSRLLLVND